MTQQIARTSGTRQLFTFYTLFTVADSDSAVTQKHSAPLGSFLSSVAGLDITTPSLLGAQSTPTQSVTLDLPHLL